MRVGDGGKCHLTYCTNIHPGESWEEVLGNLVRYLPDVKARVSPDKPFGLGLRLSALAARELGSGDALPEFRRFLADSDIYVFTVNGFPYGPFHGTAVKQRVYQPDWMTEERLAYTDQLADILAVLLEDAPEVAAGSISTVPGTFKPLADGADKVAAMTDMLIRHVAHLVKLEARTGHRIALALEPEPYCFLETIAETIAYFDDHLFADAAARRLAALTGSGDGEAARALRRHLGVCLDLCHAAVEFEDPVDCLARLRRAEIPVSKMQITAGLRLPEVTPTAVEALKRFDDDVYLHQVVARQDGALHRYVDLPDAMNDAVAAEEWRVHFHVPVFLDDLGAFSSTQSFIEAVLAEHRKQPVSDHLEVETYTWDVLPERFRSEGIVTAIVREIEWVKARLSS